MRKSKQKTPLAVLRVTLGLDQQSMSRICGCSVPMVKQLEGAKKRLSRDKALRVVSQTGVNLRWLLGGEPGFPITDVLGQPYEKAFYLQLLHEYTSERHASRHDGFLIQSATYAGLGKLLLLMLGATEEKRELELIVQLHCFLEDLQLSQEFRMSEKLASELLAAIPDDATQGRPDPTRFVTRHNVFPAAKDPPKTEFDVAGYARALAGFEDGPKLVGLLWKFGNEIDRLVGVRLRDAHNRREPVLDKMPQLVNATGLLLPLARTRLAGNARRDYRAIAEQAVVELRIRQAVTALMAEPDKLNDAILDKLVAVEAPPELVEVFRNLLTAKSKRIILDRAKPKPRAGSVPNLKQTALREAERRVAVGELCEHLENLSLESPGAVAECQRRLRALRWDTKLRRVLEMT